jgi:uncharacterized repeat protein (TIGR04076 family)
MKAGDYFTVRDGDLRIPAGGYVCLWALQSLLPLLPAKERRIAEDPDEDWLWRVHHAQCPDPEGRVIWEIRKLGMGESGISELGRRPAVGGDLGLGALSDGSRSEPAVDEIGRASRGEAGAGQEGGLRDLRVVVEEVRGKCTSGMRPGDHFALRSGRLTLPAERHFCLYALAAVLPMLPAKQRPLAEGDWLKGAERVICPDPAGNVVLRIETG